MGIPKFWKWLSDRQPQINQDIGIGREAQESLNDISYNLGDQNQHSCDHLYLDLNSLVHAASHGNRGLMEAGLSTKMLDDIMNYIDFLVRICNPQKLLYIALDGVAPRAKMNQQRIRRFKTAKDKEDALEEAKATGAIVPKDPFDSNCITPGTEFMTNLNTELAEYIRKKVSWDLRYSSIRVVFSGSDVPGEGEHKIMDQVRQWKLSKEYDPNIKHWIQGLDADLIILALISHEMNFTIIREKVQLGTIKPIRGFNTDWVLKEFTLTHVNLIREYLALDFKELLNEEFDLDLVIDDLVLILVFVGNDFVPRLPSVSIKNGSLDQCIDIYKNKLTWKDRKMNQNGIINWAKLKRYMKELANQEYEDLMNIKLGKKDKKKQDRNLIDQAYTHAHQKNKYDQNNLNPKNVLEVNELNDMMKEMNVNNQSHPNLNDYKDIVEVDGSIIIDSNIINEEYTPLFPHLAKIDEFESEPRYPKRDHPEDDWLNTYMESVNAKGHDYAKSEYYYQKMKIDDEKSLEDLVKNQLEGLQFVCLYYQKGVPSWSWQYGYHYAPMISDVEKQCEKLLREQEFKGVECLPFEKSKPFLPLQQLLAVQPPGSRKLLPAPLANLMVDPESIVLEFQPLVFDEDYDNVKYRQEAVALVPFIDVIKLVQAQEKVEKHISKHEIERNKLEQDKVIWFNSEKYMEHIQEFEKKIKSENKDQEKFKSFTFNNDLKLKLKCTEIIDLSETPWKFVKRGCFIYKNKIWKPDPLMPTFLNSRVKFESKMKSMQLNTVGWFPTECNTISLSPKFSNDLNLNLNHYAAKQINKLINQRTPCFAIGNVTSVISNKKIFYWSKGIKNSIQYKQDEIMREIQQKQRQLRACLIDRNDLIIELQPMVGLVGNGTESLLPVFSASKLYVPLSLCTLITDEEYKMATKNSKIDQKCNDVVLVEKVKGKSDVKLLNAKHFNNNQIAREAELPKSNFNNKFIKDNNFTKLKYVSKDLKCKQSNLELLLSSQFFAQQHNIEQRIGLNWYDIDLQTHDPEKVKQDNEQTLSKDAIAKLTKLIKNNPTIFSVINELPMKNYSMTVPNTIEKKEWKSFTQDIEDIKNKDPNINSFHSKTAGSNFEKEMIENLNNNEQNGKLLSQSTFDQNQVIRNSRSFYPVYQTTAPSKFRIGDRVMNIRNHWVPFGQIGYVVGITIVNIMERAAQWLGSTPCHSIPLNYHAEPKTFLDVIWNSPVGYGIVKSEDERKCRVSHHHVLNFNSKDNTIQDNNGYGKKDCWIGDQQDDVKDQIYPTQNQDLMKSSQVGFNLDKIEEIVVDRSPQLNQQILGKLKTNKPVETKNQAKFIDTGKKYTEENNQLVISQSTLEDYQKEIKIEKQKETDLNKNKAKKNNKKVIDDNETKIKSPTNDKYQDQLDNQKNKNSKQFKSNQSQGLNEKSQSDSIYDRANSKQKNENSKNDQIYLNNDKFANKNQINDDLKINNNQNDSDKYDFNDIMNEMINDNIQMKNNEENFKDSYQHNDDINIGIFPAQEIYQNSNKNNSSQNTNDKQQENKLNYKKNQNNKNKQNQ